MGKSIQVLSDKTTLIASSSSWIEGKAIQQLEKTAQLDGMLKVAGMPDLHPGRGYPIGAAFASVGKFYPALVGNDIGCGMSLWQTDIKLAKLNLEKLAQRLTDVEGPLSLDWQDYIARRKLEKHITQTFDSALGTIGGGNHFAEFQAIDKVLAPELFATTGLNKKQLQLLVHSGSRGLGQKILRQHVEEFSHSGLIADTPQASRYLQQHDEAVRWAELNRELIAMRFLEAQRAEGACALDVNHNLVSPYILEGKATWLHRKGATPADQGLVIIPGSRGDYSYLVKPIAQEVSLASLAHGAGRKWVRGDCKDRLKGKYKMQDLYRTALGSRVICGNKELLYDEAPEAYKKCDDVIGDMLDAGLIQVIARLKPVLTFKTQGECS